MFRNFSNWKVDVHYVLCRLSKTLYYSSFVFCPTCRFGVPRFMFDYMARSFIAVIKPLLEELGEEGWNEAVSQAWQRLFQLITYGIQRGYSLETDKIPPANDPEPPEPEVHNEETWDLDGAWGKKRETLVYSIASSAKAIKREMRYAVTEW